MIPRLAFPAAPLPAPRRAVWVGIAALHALLGWGLLQRPAARPLPTLPTPLSVQLLVAEAAPAPVRLPVRLPVHLPARTAPPAATLPVPDIAWPTPALQPPAAAQVAPPPAPAEAAATATPPRAPSGTVTDLPVPAVPPPALIPASELQYRVGPDIAYPAASRRLNETGLVIVAVYVDTEGRPRDVQIHQSSGHERLDRAALAGVRAARFQPVVRDGRPVAGWARIPIPFELEP